MHIRQTITIGLAVFSMLFGAGNSVYPMALGASYAQHVLSAFLGLAITGLFVPFLGLLAMASVHGSYQQFFRPVGRLITPFIMGAIVLLVGPFGALPRTFTVAYSALPIAHIPFFWFSIAAAALVLLLALNQGQIIDALGTILSPALLVSLIWLGGAVFYANGIPQITYTFDAEAFISGWKAGYQTMDLLGALCFAYVVFEELAKSNYRKTVRFGEIVPAYAIGVGSLLIIYYAFTLAGAAGASALDGSSPEYAFFKLGEAALGSPWHLIVGIAVSLACLTTAIAIVAVFADFAADQQWCSYEQAAIVCCSIAALIATLRFDGIAALLAPPLTILYPAFIALSLWTIGAHFFGWKYGGRIFFILGLTAGLLTAFF